MLQVNLAEATQKQRETARLLNQANMEIATLRGAGTQAEICKQQLDAANRCNLGLQNEVGLQTGME